ncbi:cytochrome P450 [Tricladium varicosporioides]|nr:cytochrome P450 [Hymenoscyphus varicosporioides]
MLNLSNPAVLGLSLILLYILGLVLYAKFFHPLRHYPGPFHAKVSRLGRDYYSLSGTFVGYVKRCHEKYGDVVCIGPTELSYIDSQAWTDIYGHKTSDGHRNLPKDFARRRKSPNGAASVIVASDEDHRRQRRIQAHMFSERALSAQESLINDYVSLLISKLHKEAANPETSTVDMVKWYNYTTFDILGELAFGDSFSCLKSDILHPWITNIMLSIIDNQWVTVSSNYGWPLKRIIEMCKPRHLGQARKEEFAFAAMRARERMQQGDTDRVDFMSYILKHNDEKGMTPLEVEANASLLIIAGSETTASFLSGITYNLLRNPQYLQKLTTLIRTTFPNEQDINVLKLNQMEYLTAIIEEGFRTYPPVPISLGRLTRRGGNIICDKFVPEGTLVGVPQFTAYTSESNFRNADKFIPERWMKDAKEYESDDRKILQPFSVGPRNCIGRNLAYAEMRLILARVLWHFDFELQQDSINWPDQKVYGLWLKVPLNVRLIPRKVEV